MSQTASASPALSFPNSSFPLIRRRGSADAAPGRRPPSGRWALGKYREIVIAVLFFLVFDLAVLALNFYISFQIATDAAAINVSGRQRMLSQRTAKALFSIDAASTRGEPFGSDLQELRSASELFDATLRGFTYGGTVSGGAGQAVTLNAVEDAAGRKALDDARALWDPLQQAIAPLLRPDATPSGAQVAAAAAQARQHNGELLRLMNTLTTRLEAEAARRAAALRWVQTGGIVLALLNFVFILFKFIRRLRRSDAAAEQAGEENREILAAVREGLFLLTPDGRLGSQISQSVAELFGRPLHSGERFADVLATLVAPKTLAEACSYVDLLFSPHVKEQLVQSINPLSEVKVGSVDRLGQAQTRHLAFRFNRVVEDGQVLRLLVTVQDISARTALEAQLADERSRAHREFDFLLRAAEMDRDALLQFAVGAEQRLLDINDRLRGISGASGTREVAKSVEAIHRHVHAIKGEAAMFDLDLLSVAAHEFETLLQPLRELRSGSARKPDGATGEALLALPLPLEALLGRVQSLKQLAQRLPRAAAGAGDAATALEQAMASLARRVAQATGKQVQAQTHLSLLSELQPRQREGVATIAAQLLRNAVVHGIEAGYERREVGKPQEGRVSVSLERCASGELELAVSDDGRGLQGRNVRQRLLDLGWFSAEQLAEMSEAQVVAQIFRPGFSSEREVSEHAGRGVGLDVVQALARQLGARVLVTSRPGSGSRFALRFDAA